MFGILSRSENARRVVEAVQIVQEGVNVGYDSSAYDTPIFRRAVEKADGGDKARLEKLLDDLTPRAYRDPRRHDPRL